MAIVKEVVIADTGVTASYFRVKELHINFGADFTICGVDVEIYLNESNRRAGYKPSASQLINFDPTAITAEMTDYSNFHRMGYLILKSLPEFSGAVDLI